MSLSVNDMIQTTLLQKLGVYGNDFIHTMKFYDARLIGGACTSILSGAEVNDFDIYFESDETFLNAVLDFLEGDFMPTELRNALHVVGVTNKSITFKINDVLIQYIRAVTGTAPEIFKSFDFTVNMISYDFRTGGIEAHPTALIDLSQRILKIEGSTRYPISTIIRIQKYVSRGYRVSTKELMKVGLLVSKLNLNSFEDVVDHLGSMYGVAVENLFDTTNPFSIENAIEQLDRISILDGWKYKGNQSVNDSDHLASMIDVWADEVGYDLYESDFFERTFAEYQLNNGWSDE